MKQPYCRYCGIKIAKATKTVFFIDEGDYLHDSNWSSSVVARPASKAEAARLVNQQIVSVKYGRTLKNEQGYSYVEPKLIHSVGTWDGENYRDAYFCSDRHAVRFAYAALNAQPEMGMAAYHEALR